MLPRLFVLTDRTQLPGGRHLEDVIERCVESGAGAVVVRELDLPASQRVALVAHTAATGALTVSARQLLPGADGIHLAAGQRAPEDAPALVGRSCHSCSEVRRAAGAGTAYLTISPVAATSSKPGYGPAIGTEGVRRAVEAAGTTPVLALGGIDPTLAGAARQAGAHGIAVMGEVMRADDPGAVVRRLLAEVGH